MEQKRAFFRVVLPSMLAYTFSGIYAVVDGLFIGRSIGDIGLAGVNFAYPITALILSVGTGIGMGGAVGISISRGRQSRVQEHNFLGGTIGTLLIVGGGLTALLALTAAPLLRLMGAQGATYAAALEYIKIVILGALPQILATGFTPILRNYNKSVLAMATMVAGFVTNIVLDYVFLYTFGWGMAGVAWATVLGQLVTVVPCLPFLVKKIRPLPKRTLLPCRAVLADILRVGASPFGLSMTPNIAILLINKSAMVYGGGTAVAAYAVISYVNSTIQMLLQGVGDGSQPLMSYYLGADMRSKTLAVRRMAYALSSLVALLAAGVLLVFRREIADLFGVSPQAATIAASAIPFFAAGFFIAAICRVTIAYFYATNHTLCPYLMVYGEPLILLLLLLSPLTRLAGLGGIWLCSPIAQLCVMFVGLCFLLWESKRPAPISHKTAATHSSPGH